MDYPLPEPRDFVDAGKEICWEVFKIVKDFYEKNRPISEIPGGEHKDRNNLTTEIDNIAQKAAEHHIKTLEMLRRHEILILGEEKDKYPESLESCKTLVAFVDPIDGTDVVVRGFGNWCMAILFFYPPQRRVLASVIGHSSGEVYYATEREVGKETRLLTFDDQRGYNYLYVPKPLGRDTTQAVHLEDAGICFYGQKPKNFLAFTKYEKLMHLLQTFQTRMEKKEGHDAERLKIRLYNFGGNPMMAKLSNGDVDVVLGLAPQEVHDVLPGAYIAKRAGAIFTDLNNTPIDFGQQLLFPLDKLTYILSASGTLHTELLALVQEN